MTDETKPKARPLPGALILFHAAVMRRVMQDLSSVFHQHELTPAQVSSLFHLRERGQMTVGELGQALGLTSGTVSHLVERLVSRGLAVRAAHGGDQRQRRLELSAAGHVFLHETDARLGAALAGLIEPVQPATVAALNDVLSQVLEQL